MSKSQAQNRRQMTIEEYLSAEALVVYRIIQRAKVEEASEPNASDLSVSDREFVVLERARRRRCLDVSIVSLKITDYLLRDLRRPVALSTLNIIQREIEGWLRNENGSLKSERIAKLQGEVFAHARLALSPTPAPRTTSKDVPSCN